MRKGMTVSAALHVGVLAATLVVWPFVNDVVTPPTSLPVELLTVAEYTNIMAAEKAEDPTPVPKPTTPEPEQQTALTPPEKPVEPEPTPEPLPDAEEEATPEPVVKPPEQPKPRREKQEEFDLDSVIGLLDKTEDETDRAEEAPDEQHAEAEQSTVGVGEQTSMTVSIIDSFKQQVRRCWNFPIGAPNAEELVVTLEIELKEDGDLASVEFAEPMRVAAGNGYYRAAAEAARRAVIQCAAYKLPAESYLEWRRLILEFDPRWAVMH
jgi:outer membrane biosynthesis protein TonB